MIGKYDQSFQEFAVTSRERVKKAISFQGPDRVPHFLPDAEENDLLWLWVHRPPDIQPWTQTGQIERRIDTWGTVWERALGSDDIGEAKEYPIKDITQQAQLEFPDLNNHKYFHDVINTIEQNNLSKDPKYCLGVMPFNALNECTHGIMGLENMFIAYYEHKADLKALIARLAQAQRESIRRLADCGCDGIMGYDDWGLQDRLMVSRELIEEFFMPHYRENWQWAHDLGMDVWMHSCGYILDILPTFAEAGLNVVQMDQQENIGLDRLNEIAGGRIAFWCPVDIQKTMVNGTIEDVQNYVKRMICTLGSHSGGLVSMAYSTPETVQHDPEKTAAMCKAFRDFGLYERTGVA